MDTDGVWIVGVRLCEFAPFKEDHKPPALLPQDSQLTKLLMIEAHNVRHSGIVDTVSQFRQKGYWTPGANSVAKKVKKNCVVCRYLDCQPLYQVMGRVPMDRLVNLMFGDIPSLICLDLWFLRVT